MLFKHPAVAFSFIAQMNFQLRDQLSGVFVYALPGLDILLLHLHLNIVNHVLQFRQPFQESVAFYLFTDRWLRCRFKFPFIIQPHESEFLDHALQYPGVDFGCLIGKSVNQRRVAQQIDGSRYAL